MVRPYLVSLSPVSGGIPLDEAAGSVVGVAKVLVKYWNSAHFHAMARRVIAVDRVIDVAIGQAAAAIIGMAR
jgi:hypothetical protein